MVPGEPETLTDSEWDRLQDAIALFESAWRRGDRPQIGDHLPEGEPRRQALLIELVHADLEFRIKAGESARVEDYLRKYPTLSRARSTVLSLIRAEWSFRRRREPSLTLDRIRQRFPDFGDELESTLAETGTRSETSTLASVTFSTRSGSNSGVFSQLPLPRRLGKFELRQRLGSGSFGVVYRAWDTVLNREVALKLPRPELIANEAQVRAFLREARNAIHLKHPHIVAIHDAGPIDGTVCLVRSYIEGMTLADRLKEAPYFPEESAALMILVAEALDHAHRHRIIHRDLKPSNILLDLFGQPFVSDFGLAKRELGDSTLSADGRSGSMIGTPAYMSPEQARGETFRVDARSDLFSAGVVLYELLTGSLPFQGRGRLLQLQIENLVPTRPQLLNEDVPIGLESICLKALAKNPDDRYQTALAMADDLRAFLEGRSIALVRGPGRSRGAGTRTRPKLRLFPIASTAALVVALMGSTAWLIQVDRHRQRDSEALDRTYRALLDLTRPIDDPSLSEADRGRPLTRRIWDQVIDLAPGLDGDPALLEVSTDAQLRLAALATSEGSDRLAEPRWTRAIELCEASIRRRPDNLSRQADLAQALAGLARVRNRAGLAIEARRLFDRSMTVWSQVLDDRRQSLENPETVGSMLESAEFQVRSMEAASDAGRLVNLDETEEIVDNLNRRPFLEPSDRSRLARLAIEIARWQLVHQQPTRSRQSARLGIRLFETSTLGRLAEAGLARGTLALARANRDLGWQNEANSTFARAASRFETLARDEPDQSRFRRELATTLFETGQALEQSRGPLPAIEAYRKAIRVRLDLIRDYPESHADRASLAEARAAIGRALAREGRPVASMFAYLNAIADETRASLLAPGIVEHRRKVAEEVYALAVLIGFRIGIIKRTATGH